MRKSAFEEGTEGGIGRAVIAFAQFVRASGLNVGIQETLDALEASRAGILEDRTAFRYALKALFCCHQEDGPLFDRLFKQYWDTEGEIVRPLKKAFRQSVYMRKHQSSLVMMGRGRSQEEAETGKNVSGANAMERLRETDFSKVNEMERELLEELAMRLWKEMSRRLRRRRRASAVKGRIDLRRTIRRSVSLGGDPIELMRLDRKPRKQRLVMLLDVSGSMDKYSFFLLRFIFALQEHFEQIEAFTFSTELQRITNFLRSGGLQAALDLLSAKAEAWSSGTKIGACLKVFNETYAKRVLAGNSMVIVLSDGLDTGPPEALAAELQQIAMRSRRLVWLNPLKGTKGYEPTARGMNAALPLISDFRAAHNLESLLELENLLVHV